MTPPAAIPPRLRSRPLPSSLFVCLLGSNRDTQEINTNMSLSLSHTHTHRHARYPLSPPATTTTASTTAAAAVAAAVTSPAATASPYSISSAG